MRNYKDNNLRKYSNINLESQYNEMNSKLLTIKHLITIAIELTMISKFKTIKADRKQYNMIIIELEIHNKRPTDVSL